MPDGRLLRDFPSLSSLGADQWAQPVLQALKRSLDRMKLDPGALAGIAPELQAQQVRAAIVLLAQSSIRESQRLLPETESLASQIQQTADLRSKSRDLLLLEALLSEHEQGWLLPALREAESNFSRRLQERSAALIQDKMSALSERSTEWQGRTALVPLEDGSILAFKGHKPGTSAHNEGMAMEFARHVGVEAPIPLPQGEQDHYRTTYDKKELPRYHRSHENFLPYLIPANLAEGYRTYLSDQLPKGLSFSAGCATGPAISLMGCPH